MASAMWKDTWLDSIAMCHKLKPSLRKGMYICYICACACACACVSESKIIAKSCLWQLSLGLSTFIHFDDFQNTHCMCVSANAFHNNWCGKKKKNRKKLAFTPLTRGYSGIHLLIRTDVCGLIEVDAFRNCMQCVCAIKLNSYVCLLECLRLNMWMVLYFANRASTLICNINHYICTHIVTSLYSSSNLPIRLRICRNEEKLKSPWLLSMIASLLCIGINNSSSSVSVRPYSVHVK